MSKLALGYVHSDSWYVLNGDGQPEGILGTDYAPRLQEGESVQEKLHIGLRGSLAAIHTVIRDLQTQLDMLGKYRQDGNGIGHPLYLRMYCGEDDCDYFSEISAAHLETAPSRVNPLDTGSLGLDLIIQRLNHWDSAEIGLPLSNANGSGLSSPLTVYNHSDAGPGHQNFFIASGGYMQTDRPAPLRLEVCNTEVDGDLGDVYIGAYAGDLLGSSPKMIYECEDADSGAVSTADENCSGGAYSENELVSSGPGSTFSSLLSWELEPDDLQLWCGRWVLPLLRLNGALSVEAVQLRLCVRAGGLLIYEGVPVDFCSGKSYQAFPALRLPVGDLPRAGSPMSQSLCLEASSAVAGTFALDLDFLLLLPMDYFSLERAIIPLAYGQKLVEDAFTGKAWSVASDAELKTHQQIGNGLLLERNQLSHFYLFQTQSSGQAPIAKTAAVRAWYRRRKLVL